MSSQQVFVPWDAGCTWYLVRHGQTEWNRTRRIQGQSDVPLNEHGRAQAEALGKRLSDVRFDAAYSSDLSRTMESAELVTAARACEIVPTPELREFSYGEWEGMTIAEIEAQAPERLRRRLQGRNEDFAGPGGENACDVLERVRAFYERALQRHGAGDRLLVVAHGGSLRALLVCLLDLPAEHFWRVHLDTASLSIVRSFDGSGVLHLWNDTRHLASIGALDEEE
ncbi:MAG: histidine phosphatase family protein [Chloroflexi bacterium]|nr:histidine phosphatase family protein [Chloroflexota bacterium]MYC02054.1 histidine phosphatase family protein [Chloroflexota bacterium]